MNQSLIAAAMRADADIDRIEAAGLGSSQRCLARIRSGFARMFASRGTFQFSAQAELLNHLAPVMSRTLAIGHAMGERRTLLNMRAAGLEDIALDRFSEVMRQIRAAGVGRNLSTLQRRYARTIYDTLRQTGANIDATTRATIASLIADREPMGRGMKILTATLDKLGVGHESARLETLYRTEVAKAYAAGELGKLRERWGDVWGFRYVTMHDDRVRPTHASWDGTTLPKTSRFWQAHYPPCGWNCRCRLVAIFKTPGYKPKLIQPGKIGGVVAEADDGFGEMPSDIEAMAAV